MSTNVPSCDNCALSEVSSSLHLARVISAVMMSILVRSGIALFVVCCYQHMYVTLPTHIFSFDLMCNPG